MYLRLKHHQATGFAGRQPRSAEPVSAAAVRDELLRRHYAAFDWQNGGQPGPLKYIDLHQLELAAHLVRAGDGRARVMLKRYVRGIERLVAYPHNGAAHYASGPAWNTPCRTRTLAGQAIAIQALVVIGRVQRSRAHSRIVVDLAEFVRSAWTDDTGAADSSNPAPLRDRAWFVSALGAFAELYDDVALRAAALARFERLIERVRDRAAGTSCGPPGLTLCDCVAIATVAGEFSAAGGGADLARFAREVLARSARRYAHPAGAWVQTYRDGVPPDLDCSIDLVRAADALRSRDHPHLACLAAAGKRSLFAPDFALARQPESGLLLLLNDAGGENPRCRAEAPAREWNQGPRRTLDKLLVSVRK